MPLQIQIRILFLLLCYTTLQILQPKSIVVQSNVGNQKAIDSEKILKN